MSTGTTAIDWQAGPRLRAWLKAQDPPRPVDIARRAGVSPQFINTILAGHAKPSPRVVKACAELGIPVDDVIFAGGEPDANLEKSASPAFDRAQGSRETTSSDQVYRTVSVS